jgi:CBS domain containing-hemolysin-like protein
MTALRLVVVFSLVFMNAFFVAAEFALVAVRPSRLRQLIAKGHKRAVIVQTLAGDLDRIVSGTQMGITLSSLGLGWVGELTFADIFRPLLGWLPGPQATLIAHTAALTLAFLSITFLHVVLGELVPKSLALQRAERVALLVARPLDWFLRAFLLVIDGLNWCADLIVRAFGHPKPVAHSLVRSREELRILVEDARHRGLLQLGEEKFIGGALELGQLQVREIMVPRPDMHMLPVDATLEETMKAFATTQRSRIPVYQETPDHILGFVHIKDMLWILLDRERRTEEGLPPPDFHLRRVLREILIVPESKLVSELLVEFRRSRACLAMVVDEFGSILGLLTLEDILEQLVGEIHDEFDVIERPLTLADGAMIFDASLNVRDLETQYNIVLPDDLAYETVGGFVLSQLGFIPRGGESFEYGGLRFTVVEMDRRRVAKVKIQRLKSPETQGAPGELSASRTHTKPQATSSG